MNGPDRNVILKARLTFEMPSWEDGPGDSPADTGSDFGLVPDFGDLFSLWGFPGTGLRREGSRSVSRRFPDPSYRGDRRLKDEGVERLADIP